MADSGFVFETGEAIQVGTHGETDFLFHSGDPVVNSGRSSLVFESGTGLGTDVITGTIFDVNGNELETLTLDDNTYSTGGIGMRAGLDGEGGAWDHARLTDGTIIDDFEDADISEYQGDTGGFNIVTSPVIEGTYAVQTNPDSFKEIFSLSGLNHYPERGEPFRVWIYADTGTARLLVFHFARQADDARYRIGFNPTGDFHIARFDGSSVVNSTVGSAYAQDGSWYEFKVEW